MAFNNGEQFIPEVSSKRLADEHIARYEFALQYAHDMVVLDVACGTGYGANMLAGVAKQVYGVDLSAEAITFAKDKYVKTNLTFMHEDCTVMNFPDKTFDLITSFETIEHLDEMSRKKFLAICKRVLKDDGVMFLSTPNKRVTSPYTEKPLNTNHILEFTFEGLRKEVSEFYDIEERLGQRYILKFLLIKYVRKATRVIEKIFRIDLGLYSKIPKPEVRSHNRDSMFEPRIFILKLKKL